MPYARAKAASEVWLRARSGTGSVDTVILRPGIVWGVRSPHTIEFSRSLCQKSAYLVDNGTGIFNGIYIDNLVDCICAASRHPEQASGFYNVGDRETITWREFFEALGGTLECDPALLPNVSGDRFPHSIGSVIDSVQSLSLVNDLYHRLKHHVPDGVKSAIKARIEGEYSFGRHAASYALKPAVSRELWHLQRVRHKLPIDKFVRTFAWQPPVSFREAIRRTTAWLDTLGLVTRPQGAGKDSLDVA
jgi:nucleoside-diphosphate-sugar epimerase